jgi:hypothetical protein
MASSKTQSSESADAGTPFKIVVRVCGLLAVGAIFLPFMGGDSILDIITGFREASATHGFGETFKMMVSGGTAMGTILKILLLSSYILFPVFGLGMLIRGKYAGGPLTFILLFNLAAFLLVNFFGSEVGIDGNFFANVGIGYWIGCGGLFLPFIAMFFLDKSI